MELKKFCDRRLRQLAARHRCTYSRYADDLTFSSNRQVFTEQFHQELKMVLAGANYELNAEKQRLQTRAMRQEVTGVVVNEKPNVSRQYQRQLRAILHNWETKGKAEAAAQLQEVYATSSASQRRRRRPPNLARVVAGKIAYLGMIRGKEDALYQAFATKLAALDNEAYKELSKLVSVLKRLQQLTVTVNGHDSAGGD